MNTTSTYIKADESRIIDSSAIQKVLKNPSGPPLSVKVGDTISIYTNKDIKVHSTEVSFLTLVVKEINNRSVEGWYEQEIDLVKVKLEDINQIVVWKTITYKSPAPGYAIRGSINAAIVLLVVLLIL